MASPLASGAASPQVRFFRGSRPPSPSVFPGMLNLETVNEKLRQRTATPESPSADNWRAKARKPFDELVELGGIPLRPWIDYHAEDLTDGQRGSDNGESYIRNRYLTDRSDWETQLRLWRRFSKRRSQDHEPDLRDLDPIDAVSAFIAYLRDHLQRDLQDRAKPGCEIWSGYTHMTTHRDLIEDIVKLLPMAEGLLRQLQKEKGDADAPNSTQVTRDGLIKEYKIPHRRIWLDLWEHSQESLTASEPASPQRGKRRRDDADGEEAEGEARPTKRRVSSPTAGDESASTARQSNPRKGGPASRKEGGKPKLASDPAATAAPLPSNSTKRGKAEPKEKVATGKSERTHRKPSGSSRGKAVNKKPREPARSSQRTRAAQGSVIDAAGLRRSARIAARNSRSR